MTLDRSHVPALPAFTFYLRYAQLVVAIVVLGLSAYVVTYFAYSGASLSLFTAKTSLIPHQAIATLIIAVYNIVTITIRPAFYNYWAVLGLDAFALIFWLISFSLLASEAAAWSIITHYSDNCAYSTIAYCYKKRALIQKLSNDYHTYRNAMAAGAGLGGSEFVLFVFTLAFSALAVLKHRSTGGHCVPNLDRDHVATEQRDQETLAPPQHQTHSIPLQSHV
ncbi:hypothetical protein BKA65DRAFT_408846 [Rhexocercosporidium sp. MPI-PUGE-AT-0058]|nr:hypothetical protein BKA65DRAFT_408846 [Rhexocercosporidium sp. MPI-PUGE-AT-0058]